MGRKNEIACLVFLLICQLFGIYQGSKLVEVWNPWLRTVYIVNGFLILSLDVAWLVKRVNEIKKRTLQEQLFEYELKKGLEERREEQRMELERDSAQLRAILKSELKEVREVSSSKVVCQKEQIKNILDKARHPWDRRRCANAIGDAVLREKEQRCRENLIQFQMDMQLSQEIGVSDYHLCSLLSNLIDNAIEACNVLKTEKRWMKVYARTDESYLYLEVENGCSQEYLQRPRVLGRGLGLQIVNEIVKKYGGTFQAESGEDWYRAKVLVQLGEDEQKNE